MQFVWLVGPLLLGLVHMAAGQVQIARALRPVWISFAGGVAIAYVFIHILPVLFRFVSLVDEMEAEITRSEWIFGLALLGTCAYFAIETLFARQAEGVTEKSRSPALGEFADFAIHIGAFALYNFLIGYLLADFPPLTLLDAAATYGALMLHFAVIDTDLRSHHKALYDRYGRWIMAFAVVLGGAAGVIALLPTPLMASGFAFLAGGMILNVFKEELPTLSSGRLLPFLAGASLFGLLFVLA